jgi:hypothetical protein
VNFALKAVASQKWQVATVIQMGMGQYHSANVFWRCGAGIPVSKAQLFVALKQTAIDQQFFAVVLDTVFGAGNRVGTA